MKDKKPAVSMLAATSLGVGAMVGAGIFALLGEASVIAGNQTYLAFALAGLVTLTLGYSYAKLGVRYPSRGGVVAYLVEGFGPGLTAGTLNVLFWFALLFGIATVAKAFGNYAASLLSEEPAPILAQWSTVFVVVFFTLLNFVGSKLVSNFEKWIVLFKLIILVVFCTVALSFAQSELLTPQAGQSWISAFDALGVVFFAFTGFGIITNTAEDLKNPAKDLPRALFLSIGGTLIIYLLIALAVTGNLPRAQIVAAKDFALAEAAKPIFGTAGFQIMAVAALISTASAINASLYGAANVSYIIAKKGFIPPTFERRLWKQGSEGLLLSAILILAMASFLDLSDIASVGSAIILLIYVMVNISHLRLIRKTGAKPFWIVLSLLLCAGILIFFLHYKIQSSWLVPGLLLAAVFTAFVVEFFMQKLLGRKIAMRRKSSSVAH